jgi:hypothetical protein
MPEQCTVEDIALIVNFGNSGYVILVLNEKK